MKTLGLIMGLISMFVLVDARVIAQDSEVILTNDGVVEMVKATIPSGIIIAKIKNSKTRFDTSTSGLRKLQEVQVPEDVILAMIERGNSELEESEKPADAGLPVLNPKLAVGKRKVFIETNDEESKVELTKRLTNRKFQVVDTRDQAELIFQFSVVDGVAQTKTGIFRGVETTRKTRTGKLVVSLYEGKPIGIVFAREWEPKFILPGYDSGPPNIRDQIRYFFIPKFADLMNDAGDKIR